jgi:hypothetical protein
MKLRIRTNTLRLRLNQKEVEGLAAGQTLKEQIDFPGGTSLAYSLGSSPAADPQVFFANGKIQITAPHALLMNWVSGEDLGLHLSLPTGAEPLKISIEKDLVCIDGPVEERDPHAFPRELASKFC